MLGSNNQIIEYARNAERLWLVVLDHEGDSLRIDPQALWPGGVEKMEIFRPERDKRIEIWKIELRKNATERDS
jgi:hypothetical protein